MTCNRPYHVLHVDDEPGFTDTAAAFLERADDRFTVEIATSAGEGIERLAQEDFDCVVSDYDLPEQNGIEFLETVRKEYPDLPFLLTDEGTEKVASDAISAGATDYLQKGSGTDRCTLLANRIENAVERYRARRRAAELDRIEHEQELQEDNDFINKALDTLDDLFYVVGRNGEMRRWNKRLPEVTGYTDDEIADMHAVDFFPEDERESVSEAITKTLETGRGTVETVVLTRAGDRIPYEFTGARLTGSAGGLIGSVGVGRDITDRKQREAKLKRQNERLEEFTGVVSHDLRSPLNMASNYLSLLETEYDDQRIQRIDTAVDRAITLVDDLLTLARQGSVVDETRECSLSDIARRAWEAIPSDGASLTIEEDLGQAAVDESRLRQAFENLFRNSVDHAGTDTQIRVGMLADGGGFYVSDDGPGIAADQRDRVFDHGYTTSDSGTGLGLTIVKRIFEAHRWQVHVTGSRNGGARFEVTGLEMDSGPLTAGREN